MRLSTFKAARALAALLLGLAAGTAAAQQTPLPSRQEVTPPAPDPRDASTVAVDAAGTLERPACPFEGSPLRVALNRVEFTRPDGSALQPELAGALAGLVLPTGDQPISAVCTVRDRANAALRRGGWVASVQIPAQEIADGTLRLQVVAARIVEMRVRGEPGPYRALLADRIRRIQASDPLNERETERLLLLAGDTPGLEVQLSLRPAGGEQGAVIGELTVAFRRFALLANVQNFNARFLGRETGYLRGEVYGLTGLSDLTYVGLSATAQFEEQRIVQVGHIFGLDGNGTTLGGRFTYAQSRPELGALDLRTDTLIAGFDIARPLVRSLRGNVRLRGGYDHIDQDSEVRADGEAVPLTTDRLRVAYLALDADHNVVRPDGSTALSAAATLELRQGLDLFGSSERGFVDGELTSRIDGSARAFVARLNAEGVLALGRIFSVAALGQVQWANKPLLSYEEYSIGNLQIGRGYDPGSNSGDRAVGGRVELRAGLPSVAGLGPQLFGFYDHVHVRNLDRNALERSRDFASVGGGARLALPGSVVLEVIYAHPLDRTLLLDEDRPSDRLLLSLTAQFRDKPR